MTVINLRNQKTSSFIISLLLLGFSFACFYWASLGTYRLEVAGVRLDMSSSSLLLYVLAAVPFYHSARYATRLYSLLGYGAFVLTLSPDHVSFPQLQGFKGYRRVNVSREFLRKASLVQVDKYRQHIQLENIFGHVEQGIDADLCAYRQMKPEEVTATINHWINA